MESPTLQKLKSDPGSLHLPSELQQKPGSFRRDRSETAGRPLSTTEGQDKTALLVLRFRMKGLCRFPHSVIKCLIFVSYNYLTINTFKRKTPQITFIGELLCTYSNCTGHASISYSVLTTCRRYDCPLWPLTLHCAAEWTPSSQQPGLQQSWPGLVC